ncbi:MAG: hypothetical protein HGA95_02780, partial [Caldiserica bacterium]|nr:hypothetical protein [Caldisericota bacterium]
MLGNKPGIKAVDKSMLDDNQIIAFTSEAMKAPIINVDVTSLDFGTITANSTKSFSISNSGTDTLTGTVNAADRFISVEPNDFSIEAGSLQTFTVTANVTGLEQSTKNTSLKIESNAGNSEIPVSFTYEKAVPTTPPVLDVTPVLTETTDYSVSFIGTTSQGAVVTVNTKPAIVDSNGKFSVTVKLFV